MRGFRNRAVLLVCSVSCFCAAVTPTLLFGQVAGTASISGRVTDASNAAVPAATVTIKNTATTATQTVNTDDQGRYTVPDLPIGPYDIIVSKTGFQSAARNGLALTVGSSPVLDFQLTVGQATETVSVSAEVSQVETTTLRSFVAGESDPDARIAAERARLGTADSARARRSDLSAGRIECADFGRQCVLHLGHDGRKDTPIRWMAKTC